MSTQNTVTVTSSSGTTPLQVSWQAAFWTLVSLATIVITQPSGRVLSAPRRYHTYLRSSPILCLLDALSFTIRILLTRFLLGLSFQQAFDITMQERYVGTGERTEGIQGLEKWTLLRWIFFWVATFGPAIKLATMQGMPWTKAWGMMFLFSFLVFELMLILGTTRRDSRGERYKAVSLGVRDAKILRGLSRRERQLFYTGLVLHSLVLVWAILDIWSIRGAAYDRLRMYENDNSLPILGRFTPPFAALSVLGVIGLGSILGGLISATTMTFYVSIRHNTETARYGSWAAKFCPLVSWLLVLVFELGYLGGLIYLGWKMLYKIVFVDIIILLSCVGAVPSLIFGITWLSGHNRRLGSILLISPPDRRGLINPVFVDQNAVLALVFFVINLIVCMLWYSFRFSSEGTHDPSWRMAFG